MRITIDLGTSAGPENLQNIALANNWGAVEEQAILDLLGRKMGEDLDRLVQQGQQRREQLAIAEKTRAIRGEIKVTVEM